MDIKSIPKLFISLILPTSIFTSNRNEDNSDQCELIGTFSLITQAFLGLLCLSSLIIKRSYEYPIRRTWPVWLFDVLKQLIGAAGVHVFNILLSILKTRKLPNAIRLDEDDGNEEDPCDWYFLNIVFDCTIGVYILYIIFTYLTRFLQKSLGVTKIESGNYGNDPQKPSFIAFLKQLIVYFSSLMITKIILYGIMECFETQLLWFTSHILLLWLDKYPDEMEIFIVMFVVPILMNCLQLILIDNFIQSQVLHKANIRWHHVHDQETQHINSESTTDSIQRSTEGVISPNSSQSSETQNILKVSNGELNKSYGSL